MRTDYIDRQEFEHVLSALTPQNRLVMAVAIQTGLRVGDVLNLRSSPLRAATARRITVQELKTGKRRRLTLPAELYDRMLSNAGKIYVFPHRLDWRRHRTRQAVWKDIKRASKAFRVKLNIAPHSARKTWAVAEFRKDGSIAKVQEKLNHSSSTVTAVYALADQLTARKYPRP